MCCASTKDFILTDKQWLRIKTVLLIVDFAAYIMCLSSCKILFSKLKLDVIGIAFSF